MKGALIPFLILLSCASCGGAQLSAYAATQSACLQAEEEIIKRPPTTYEQDRLALEVVRASCDAILSRLERQMSHE